MNEFELISKNFFTLKIGKIIKLKDNNTFSVEIEDVNGTYVLEEARACISPSVNYAPQLASEVLLGFVSNAISSPVILGEFAKSSEDMVSIFDLLKIDNNTLKLHVGNNTSSLKEILNLQSAMIMTISTALEGVGVVTDLKTKVIEMETKIASLFT